MPIITITDIKSEVYKDSYNLGESGDKAYTLPSGTREWSFAIFGIKLYKRIESYTSDADKLLAEDIKKKSIGYGT